MDSVTVSIDYPTEPLNKTTTFFRLIVALPIFVILSSISTTLFLGPLLMIVFRQKYPRWWFEWNLQMTKFSTRVSSYLLLMTDKYPSTDEEQNVHINIEYPEATKLNRWLPIIKWILVIPHIIVLAFLFVGVIFTTLFAWFAILFTGKYPKSLFNYAEGVLRWSTRVTAYAFLLTTDQYPEFSLK